MDHLMHAPGLVRARSGGAPWYLAGGIAPADCVIAYQPVGAASQAESYINLANPGTCDAAPGTAPAWHPATGWTFTGSQFLTTGFVPVAGMSHIVRFANAPQGTSYGLWGAYVGGNARFGCFPRYDGTNSIYYNGYFMVRAHGGMHTGTLGCAGLQPYRNGIPDGAPGGQSWSGTSIECYIGKLNGYGGTCAGASIQALAVYNTVLTAAQFAALHAAMTAL